MPKVTCTAYRDGEYVARRTGHAENGSEAVARNSALMQLANDDEVDWDDDYNIKCDAK